ncbi:MAG: ArnT family glycosyltransferase [Chloroflexaceae bacterium]
MKQLLTTDIPRIPWLPAIHQMRALPLGQVVLLGVLLLLSGLFLRSGPLQTEQQFALGGVGRPLAQDFHPGETTTTGQSFRWTDGDSTLHLPPQSQGAHTLRLTVSAPWPEERQNSVPLTMTINGRVMLTTEQSAVPRRYAFLVPADRLRWSANVVRLESPTFRPDEVNRNERRLGLAVFTADWRGLERPGWLVPAQILTIGLVIGLLYLLLLAAGIPFWARLPATLLLLAIMLAMRHSDSRFVYRLHALLMTAALAGGLALLVALLWRRRVEPIVLPVRAWLRQHWPAFAGYVVLTAIMLLPLIVRLPTHIIGPPGDNLEYLWKMHWFSTALIEQHVSPVFAPQIFYPGGADLTVSEVAPAHHLLGVPVTWLFGPVVGYNLVMVSTFVLTAFFTYLLARRLGARPGAAWVAGIIFAFCLRRYFHANGHFGMMGSQWVALTLYGWEGVLTRRRTWDGYVAGMGYVLAAWSSLMYGATLPFFLAAYTPLRLGLRQLPELLPAWRPLLVMGTLCVALVLPLAQPYYEAQQQGSTFKHIYSQLILHAAVPEAYFLPNPFHPLWGDWASQFYRADAGEQYVAFGYTALALALVGFWLGRRQRVVQALALLIVINFVMTLGPELRLNEGNSIPLPAKFLYAHAPVLGNIRTWARMVLYLVLCAALLAALALSRLPQRRYRAGWIMAAVLVLVESVSVLTLSEIRPRPVDLWVRDQPGAGAVTHMPHDFGAPREYYTLLFSDRPANQGHGKFPPSLYREGRNIFVRFPDASSLRLMQRWQTDYIIVDEAAMARQNPDWRAELTAQPLVEQVYREGGYSIFRLQRKERQ